MIIIFEGTPGSGKSYEAVKKIIDNLRRPERVVYTNIDGTEPGVDDGTREYLKNICGLDDYSLSERLHHLDKHQTREFPKHCKRGSLIVIDEAHNYFNARDWQTEENRAVVRWAEEHRHQGYDVVFITTNASKIDKQVRSVVEWTYRFRKMNFFGSLVKNSYMMYTYSGEGDGQPLGKAVTRQYDKQIFQCYKSYVAADVKELKIMDHMNILKHPLFYALAVVALFTIYMFSKSSFVQGHVLPVMVKKESAHDAKKMTVADPVTKETMTAVSAAAESVDPAAFRITGKMQDGERLFYIMEREKFFGKEESRTYRLFVLASEGITYFTGSTVTLKPEIIARLN